MLTDGYGRLPFRPPSPGGFQFPFLLVDFGRVAPGQ